MTASALAADRASAPTSDTHALDAAVARLGEAAPAWARAPLADRIALARSMLAGMDRVAERFARAACEAKGIPFDTPAAGEEWLGGPYVTARFLRQVIRTLEALAGDGAPPIPSVEEGPDGRAIAKVFPAVWSDVVLLSLVRGDVRFQEGVKASEVRERAAPFHRRRDHDGVVSLVLGAGNINSIPPTDAIQKLFHEGKTCLVKLNPVNAYLGPILEDAFRDAVARNLLAFAYGGGDVGAYLVQHPGVGEVHITGGERTHQAIVWGPPGPERDARMARNAPLLTKPITSELGCVSPTLVVPGDWDDATLAFQAESVAGMVTYNSAFNCTSARMLLTPRGWRLREKFLGLVEAAMARTPARRPYYPGAHDAYARATAGRADVRRAGGAEGTLPWTIVRGLDAGAPDPAFAEELFCPVLFEVPVGGEDPAQYLADAVAFSNDRLFGTLSANVVAHPRSLSDPAVGPLVERALRDLRHGTVALNCWTGYAFGFGTTPWGGFPGATLRRPESGLGVVHNNLMLEGVEKAIIRHPARHLVKPPIFPSHRATHLLGRALTRLESSGSLATLLPITGAVLRS
ncbi:MAG: aldehyde dehydrogenase family protein [Anaeromyxobacter sp.]